MQKMTTPNCFAYSCAMVMGVRVREIFNYVGHDGLETRLEDGVSIPRGFHIQEVMDYALSIGWFMMVIQREPSMASSPASTPVRVESELLNRAVWHFNGVLIQHPRADGSRKKSHAIAWDRYTCTGFDPNGFTIHPVPFDRYDLFIAMGRIIEYLTDESGYQIKKV